jgi:hypothetical protein
MILFLSYHNYMKTKTINLMEIGNIKTKEQLKKYNIKKPFNNGNYLFHYLILTNNLTALKLTKFPIHLFNYDNYNGIMLAAHEKKYDILDYFIKNNPDLIYSRNKVNNNILKFLDSSEKEYIDIILKNTDVDWANLFECYSNKKLSGLDLLFMNGSYHNIISIIEKIKLNYKTYLYQPAYFNLLFNINLKDSQIEKILDLLFEKDNKILEYTDDLGYNIAFAFVSKENIQLTKYIVNKRKTQLDHYTPLSGNHLLLTAYKIGIASDNYEIANYIYDNIMKNHNYNETDDKGNNIVNNLLIARIMFKKGDYKLESKILKNYNNWTKINTSGLTPFDYIIQMDYKKYHKFVTNKPDKIHIEVINKKWKKYIKTLPVESIDDNVKLLNTPFVHGNLFRSHFSDMAIFGMYIKEKYKNIYVPSYSGKVEINWNDDMLLPSDLLKEYNNFPWIIIWNNENNYWIHPYLNKLIKENKEKYTLACIFLSIRLPQGGLHASLLLYDFTRNTIERFDPYGNTTIMDGMMDEIFNENLAKPCKMLYCSPECYFPVAGFQTLSDENNLFNQKLGDFGGYCLAWCLWYIEHKLLNIKVKPTDLVRKTINKLLTMKIKPMEYIRNYANFINKYRLAYLKEIGIPENLVSNENFDKHYSEIIDKSIIKYYQ